MTDNFAELRLFPQDEVVGVFRGFQQGGLEFHADLVLPYRNEFQNIPMHGQFLLVQLETPDEAVLGRITSFSSDGKLAAGAGEEFNIRAVMEDRPIPEDLREQYLKYRVNIRVLGVLRKNGDRLTFVPSHRRLPHLGSKVAFPSGPVLREIAGHNIEGAAIGRLAYGEYIYAAGDAEFQPQEWMQVASPSVMVHFPVESLVSRRSFVFARAGFGKSNLNKLLFSKLYESTPYVIKRGDRQVPVGTVIFDPDGEYFWPDDRGRPGLCDVPHLEDKLVVFTERRNPSPFYQGFVAGGIKLDIRRLRPSDVIGIALNPHRQEQQNVRKLRGLPQHRWERLVDLIDADGNNADMAEICQLLDLDQQRQEFEALAARANVTAVVRALHDKTSQLMDRLLYALSAGKLCVIDVSQMRGAQSLMLSGLILRRIFDRNQEEFTRGRAQDHSDHRSGGGSPIGAQPELHSVGAVLGLGEGRQEIRSGSALDNPTTRQHSRRPSEPGRQLVRIPPPFGQRSHDAQAGQRSLQRRPARLAPKRAHSWTGGLLEFRGRKALPTQHPGALFRGDVSNAGHKLQRHGR